MKTVNGGLLIILAFFILWIGVTGRFPKLIAAIGLVRGTAPETPPNFGGIASKTGSGSSSLSYGDPGFVGPPDALHAPILNVWQDALGSITKNQIAAGNPMYQGAG